MRLVLFHMEGRALVWFQDLSEYGGLTSWEEFVKVLLIRFGPSSYNDSMEQLTRLRQTGLVVDYKASFEALSNMLRGLLEQNKPNYFQSRLKDDIRLPVQMFNLGNLIIATTPNTVNQPL